MTYCNLALLVPGHIGQDILLAGLFNLNDDQVTENWWATKIPELDIKCNLWLCPPETKDLNNLTTLIWNKIQAVLLLTNLSDPQVIKHLNTFQSQVNEACAITKTKPQVIVLGSYQQTSPLAEAQKRSVLEWSAEQGDDWPFLEVDLQQTETLPEIWHRILIHLHS